jgi:hypothetical protein
MALVIDDRVRETTTVTGTNDATLLGAVTGFQAFSVIGDGNTTYYTISDQSGGNWEVGLGSFSAVGPTLARTTVLDSSAGGAKVSFPAGTKDVFITYPSDKAVYLDESGNVQPNLGAASFTSISDSGNLTFTGTGNRITGDFSNATVANRVLFQTSTTNSNTTIQAIPNGTAVVSQFNAVSNSDPTNASTIGIRSSDTEGRLEATRTGSGSFLPLTMFTGGSERLRIDTSGNVGIGTTSPITTLDVNGILTVRASSGEGGQLTLLNTTNSSGALTVDVDGSNNSRFINDLATNTLFYTNGIERMRIDSSGNVGIGTSSPQAKEHIAVTTSAITETLRLDNTFNTGDNGNKITWYNAAQTPEAANISGFRIGATTGFGLSFATSSNFSSTNAVERMRIDSSGNVGIGTSTIAGPADRTLQVSGTSPALRLTGSGRTGFDVLQTGADGVAYLYNRDDAAVVLGTNNAERVRITNIGRVGIGTSSPASPLDVVGRTISRLSLANGGSASFSAFSTGSAQGELAGMSFYPTFVGTGDNGPRRAADIWSGFNGGNWGTQYLAFGVGSATNDAQDVTPERMRIDSSGNVGIGVSTNSTNVLLQVACPTNTVLASRGNAYIYTTEAAGIDKGAQLTLGGQWSGGEVPFASIAGRAEAAGGALPGYMQFGTLNSSGFIVERMRITSAGKVGVGVQTPYGTFEVLDGGQSSGAYASTFPTIQIVQGSAGINNNGGLDFRGSAFQNGYGFRMSAIDSSGVHLVFGNRQNTTTYAEVMRIDSSGNLLVGTTSASPVSGITAAGQVVMAGSRAFLGTLAGGDTAVGGPAGSNFTGIYVNGVENTRFNLSGSVVLLGGSTLANGTGITFPATQSASSNANTLDDYEEGTWTPTSPNNSYVISSASGQYTKIGNVVYVRFAVVFSTVGTSNSAVVFQGLPFTVSASGTGAIREGSVTGAIYMAATAGTNGVEINSMDGVTNGSQRTIQINETYGCTFFYYS